MGQVLIQFPNFNRTDFSVRVIVLVEEFLQFGENLLQSRFIAGNRQIKTREIIIIVTEISHGILDNKKAGPRLNHR